MRALLLLIATLLSTAGLAKPLYLTVPRSFGTQEAPAVEVAFAENGPVELRVLKPNDVGAFLRAQSNLRRAYETPPTTRNPGRALSRGLNGMHEPGTFLLYAMDPKLRSTLAGGLPKHQPAPSKLAGHLQEGAPRLVGVPKEMQLVRSQWLNLDLGGTDREFNVPGFEAWSSSGGFQERHVVLQPLPAGIYVVQLVQGRIEGQVLLVISDLTVQAKQTDGQLLVRVAGLDQKPREGAQAQLYTAKGPGAAGKTNAQGEVFLDTQEPKLLATVQVGTDIAVVDTDFYSTLAVAADVFLYTDRPIYHPGDEVQFRGLARQPDSFLSRLFTPTKRNVTVKLIAETGTPASIQATVDEFGSFSGSLKVPTGHDTGVVRVLAELDGQAHQAEARVQDYVKPTFYLELTPESETVVPGQTLKAKVRARRYAGGVPPNTRYEVFLYRSLLDSPTWVDDAGKGGAGSAVTYGSQSTTEGKLSVPERLYSSIAQRANVGDVGDDPWASALTFDANGEAELSIDVPPLAPGDEKLPYRYSLSVRARDDQKTFANASASFFLSKTEVMGSLRFSAKVVRTGGEAMLSLRSTSLGGKPMPGMDGTIEFVLRAASGGEKSLSRQPFKTDENAVLRTSAPTHSIGTVLARVEFKDKKGQPWSGETRLLVVGDGPEPVVKVPSLTLEALDGVLEPGTTAQLVALFPDDWGPAQRAEGSVWLTLSGAAIYSTQLLSVKGTTLIQPFEVERRFGSGVYASIAYATSSGRWEERTVSFRIIPSERTLSVSVTPLKSEAAPLSEQSIDLRVSNARGDGISAQVSVGVVDKAVYAVQGELRPRVLDFFYPVARHNVTSFYSNEFQGYGYGELLAKTLNGLPHVRFAAVKPPTKEQKQEERDTAFWTANVVTDRDGHATVKFKLPSNQTLWIVTAVAADSSGRFGEGTAEFASRGKLNLVASVPQFLRAGDEATGSVRVARITEKAGKTFEVKVTSPEALGQTQVAINVDLSSATEQVVPFALKAARPGSAEVSINVTGSGESLADRRRIPLQPSSFEETVQVSSAQGGELALPPLGDSQAQLVELTLSPSTVDAALSNVRELLTYPYGCLEQLVSTTVPNVALYQTLEKVNALGKLDPSSQALLAEARSRAVQGSQRILGLAVKGGGFTWFGGYNQPSVPLTLIALDGLTYSLEAGLVQRNEPALTESVSWLESQKELPAELEATRVYVLTRLGGAKQAAKVRALLDHDDTLDVYSAALAVLSAEKAGILNEPGQQEKINRLVTQSRDQFFQLANFPPRDAFWRYPLRRVGLTAVLGHAASLGELDVDKARRRVLELLHEPRLSTFDRSTALLHSLWLIERDAKTLRAMAPPKVEGAGKLTFQPRGAGLTAVLPVGARNIKVAAFDGVATLKAVLQTPSLSAKARSDGMSIARRYYLLSGNGKTLLDEGQGVMQGAELYVELTLNAEGDDRVRSAYYVVEDAVPAGFVPLTEDKQYRGAPYNLPLAHESLKRRALDPEKAVFFFEEPAWWSDSPRTVGYVMRAQFAGKYLAPAATVSDMYALGRKGRSPAQTVAILSPVEKK
ncbi:MAG: MG2 domain-containing protein [Myxococcaceae bacterium]